MAFAEGGSNGTVDDTATEIVAAPASGKRIVRTMTFYNADTADAELEVRLDNNVNERIICKITLEPGDTLEWGEGNQVLVLGTTDSINANTTVAPTTTDLDWTASYGDST